MPRKKTTEAAKLTKRALEMAECTNGAETEAFPNRAR